MITYLKMRVTRIVLMKLFYKPTIVNLGNIFINGNNAEGAVALA